MPKKLGVGARKPPARTRSTSKRELIETEKKRGNDKPQEERKKR